MTTNNENQIDISIEKLSIQDFNHEKPVTVNVEDQSSNDLSGSSSPSLVNKQQSSVRQSSQSQYPPHQPHQQPPHQHQHQHQQHQHLPHSNAQFSPQYNQYQQPYPPIQLPYQGQSNRANSSTFIPQALRSALSNPIHRSFVINLENDLMNFIGSNTDSYLLSPMNSFYRLLTHKTAEYYQLGHSLNKEGNSIIVYKNFGVELIKPQPLNSIQIQQIWPSHLPPQNNSPGFSVSPQGQLFTNHQGGLVIPPSQVSSPPFQQPKQYQEQFNKPIRSNVSNINNNDDEKLEPEVKKEINPPKEFKLMKRSESSNGKKQDVINDGDKNDSTSKEQNSSVSSRSSTTNVDKNSTELESERASRESDYQKARERIFQNGEEEDDEEEEEEEEDDDDQEEQKHSHVQQNNYTGYPPVYQQGLPNMEYPNAFIPPQHSGPIPGIPSTFIPPPPHGQVPYPYYQYPPVQGIVPMYSYESKGYYQQYNPRGGYKKNRGGYNNNGYRRNNGQGQYNNRHDNYFNNQNQNYNNHGSQNQESYEKTQDQETPKESTNDESV